MKGLSEPIVAVNGFEAETFHMRKGLPEQDPEHFHDKTLKPELVSCLSRSCSISRVLLLFFLQVSS